MFPWVLQAISASFQIWGKVLGNPNFVAKLDIGVAPLGTHYLQLVSEGRTVLWDRALSLWSLTLTPTSYCQIEINYRTPSRCLESWESGWCEGKKKNHIFGGRSVQWNFNKLKRTDIIQSVFSNHIKLEISKRNITGKYQNLESKQHNNPQMKEEVSREIKKYAKLNENENISKFVGYN